MTDVWVVSLRNECKELFFKVDLTEYKKKSSLSEVDDSPGNDVILHCVNFVADKCREEVSLPYSESRLHTERYAESVRQYLYEPNASVMKTGAFAVLVERYGVDKIAQHSHLFTADEFLPDFPGRAFVVESAMPFKEKAVKAALKGEKRMNVSVRNFKLTAEQLKNRLKLSDGGDRYLFGTTTASGEMVVIVCRKADKV